MTKFNITMPQAVITGFGVLSLAVYFGLQSLGSNIGNSIEQSTQYATDELTNTSVAMLDSTLQAFQDVAPETVDKLVLISQNFKAFSDNDTLALEKIKEIIGSEEVNRALKLLEENGMLMFPYGQYQYDPYYNGEGYDPSLDSLRIQEEIEEFDEYKFDNTESTRQYKIS